MNVAVVVPTIREDCAKRFLEEWHDDLASTRLIMVEDNPDLTFRLKGCEHYCWHDIDNHLGDRAWIIPRRTSACRSYGIWLAAQDGADIIWSLDDDCYPEEQLRGRYVLNLAHGRLVGGIADDSWYDTLPRYERPCHNLHPRGFPYQLRHATQPVMCHHGLWSEHADLDGNTQKANPDFRLPPAQGAERVPTGKLFPMCVMNLAFRRDLAPAMYMLLMGQDRDGRRWGYNRFDDIWAGLFVKRICDHLGWAITSGAPSVRHSKASKAEDNILLEAPGIQAHEVFWPYVRDIDLTSDTVVGCYRELANAVERFTGPNIPYWNSLSQAMLIWADLFE